MNTLLDQVKQDLAGAPHAWPFFDVILDSDPRIETLKQVAFRFGMSHQLLGQRFQWAGLPPVPEYLLAARVVRVRSLLDEPRMTVARAAEHIGLVMPQTLRRFVRAQRGQTVMAWRATVTAGDEARRFRETLVLPYRHAWVRCDAIAPVGSFVGVGRAA